MKKDKQLQEQKFTDLSKWPAVEIEEGISRKVWAIAEKATGKKNLRSSLVLDIQRDKEYTIIFNGKLAGVIVLTMKVKNRSSTNPKVRWIFFVSFIKQEGVIPSGIVEVMRRPENSEVKILFLRGKCDDINIKNVARKLNFDLVNREEDPVEGCIIVFNDNYPFIWNK